MKGPICLRLAAAAAAIMLLAGCQQAQPVPGSASAETAETGESARTDTLRMDFTAGSNVEDVRTVELEAAVTPAALCDTLEELTGIQFDFTVAQNGDVYTVAWQDTSALILGETPQDEHQDYVFYDDDLLRWFMLDTVWRNLTEEYGAKEVLYTDPEGAVLTLESPWPLENVDLSEPYRGSTWYCEQSTGWDSGLPSA